MRCEEDLSLALARQIAEGAPAVMVVARAPDFRIVYANRAAHRAARSAPGRLVGRAAAEAFAFVDFATLAGQSAQAQRRGVAGQNGGATTWWDVTYTALQTTPPEPPSVLVTAVDITHHEIARAQAQAAIHGSEERLRAVLLQIPAAIFIVEAPDGRVTFKSRWLDDVLGNPDTDLVRARATMQGWAIHEDGTPYDLSEYPSRRALFQGETVRAEPMLYRRGDGRLIDLEMHAGPVRNKTGETVAAVAVALDVTARRLAEARQAFLLKLQDTLRGLTEPDEILIAAATHLGRHLGAARIGYSEVQPDDETVLITNGYVDGLPPVAGLFSLSTFGAHLAEQMRAGQTAAYDDAQQDERGAREFSLKLGTRAHVSVPLVRHGRYTGSLYVTHVRPHKWTPAEIALIEEVARRIWDAAERGRAEARLRESEERLRLVMDATGLGFWEYDVIARKTIRSARHDEIFGYKTPVSDWSYERFAAHIPEPDRAQVEAGFRAAVEQGCDWDVECRMIRADGSTGWLKIRARPHDGRQGKTNRNTNRHKNGHSQAGQITRLLGTVADVTERREAENAALENAAKFEQTV